MILLKLEKLEVAYQRVITAVQGVSLEVPKGSIVALLGTNGAGKTTTLRAISGFIGLDDARVTEGAILYRGERIENRPPHRVTALGIVLVPERSKVFENLTVEENRAAARMLIRIWCTSIFPCCLHYAAGKRVISPAASGRCSLSARR